MAITAAQVLPSAQPSSIVTEWDVTCAAGDTGPTAFAHGMLFTPTVLAIFPTTAPTSAVIQSTVTVTTTATQFSVSKNTAGANTGGVWRVILGRYASQSSS